MQSTTKTMFLLTSLLFLLLTGCPESKFPLSDPDKNEIDQSLVGTWVSSEKQENGHASNTRVISIEDGLPKGVLQLKETGTQARTFYLIPTVVDDVRYYSMPRFDEKWKPEMGWKPELIKGYIILKYKVKGDKLIEYLPGKEADGRLATAVKNGDIRGRIEGDDKSLGGPNIVITEPTEGLRKYVQDNDSWIYTEKHEMTKQ